MKPQATEARRAGATTRFNTFKPCALARALLCGSTMKVATSDSLPNVELSELALVTGGVLDKQVNKARCFGYRMGALKSRLDLGTKAANFDSLAEYSAAQRALEKPEPSYCSSSPA